LYYLGPFQIRDLLHEERWKRLLLEVVCSRGAALVASNVRVRLNKKVMENSSSTTFVSTIETASKLFDQGATEAAKILLKPIIAEKSIQNCV
jgi:hypothetical protein